MTETINDPSIATQKLETLNPSMNEAANINNAPFITNINNPRVTIVIGSVSTTNIGLTIKFNAPSITAEIIAGYIPDTSMPGTK